LLVWYVAKHKDVSLMDLIDDAESSKPSTDFGLELPEMGGSDDGENVRLHGEHSVGPTGNTPLKLTQSIVKIFVTSMA
jgi:hypothetical protein